jgi:CheY-like chemotaxis protein
LSDAEKVNILVVDDLPEKLLVLESVLEKLGQNVVTARSGEEALRRLLEQEFAVILLDVNMPGMDGLETAAYIRRRKKTAHTPIIFITAFADEVYTARGYALGAVDYILSPIMPEILRSKVKVFVDLFQMSQQVKRQAEEHVALAREQAARAVAEETTRRSTFLAEASRALASSLNLKATTDGLLRLVVPALGELSAILLVDEYGRLSQTELTWWDGASKARVQTLLDSEKLQASLGEAFNNVLSQENSSCLPATSQGPAARIWEALTQSEAPDRQHPVFERGSELIISLRARGKTLGVLALAKDRSGHPYAPADLALAEDVASRAAIAIDNARLYRDIQESDRRKNEFLSMLAHELRNPLAAIRNSVQILRACGPDEVDFQWAEDVIDRQAEQLIRLVDDLLDVSRISQGKIQLRTEPVAVAAVVARATEASRAFIEARKHKLSVTLPTDPVWINADPVRLSQVLGNLLHNAAKYTDEGGTIQLTVDREDTEVLLRVRDNGVGIPADKFSSIFEMFTQVDRSLDRSQGGLGIGLTLVRILVEMHAGLVQVFSAGPHQGSEFVVRLPLLCGKPPGEDVSNPAQKPTPQGPRRRVLVVDDNEDAANSLSVLLRAAGHEVRISHDGPTALKEALNFQPHVVLLDIGLPGMDGYEVARQLTDQRGPEMPLLVALSGYGQEEDVRRAREAGFHHHLIKPADLEALRALLASLTQPVKHCSAPT